MKKVLLLLSLCVIALVYGCKMRKPGRPVVGFVDAFEDNTIGQARDGFVKALADSGYVPDSTMDFVYRNAQGNFPTLTQIIKYFKAQDVTLLATCPSLSTITAVQNMHHTPIFMMVAPTPKLMKVTDSTGAAPANLFGVAENLNYIDTSFSLIPKLIHPRDSILRVGMIFNQSEPQSVDALNRLKDLSAKLHVTLVALPVNNTADVQLVTGSLLNKNIDAFFANPDNTVFGSFETIVKACNRDSVPIFTSEAGLVARGAVAAYGADIYHWGYQAGQQAAHFLKTGKTNDIHWEMVQDRHHVYNVAMAKKYKIDIPSDYKPVSQ